MNITSDFVFSMLKNKDDIKRLSVTSKTLDFYTDLVKNNISNSAISEIVYPYTKDKDNFFKTPFMFLKLENDTRDEYEKLYIILKNVVESFNLNLVSRNSFGFRNITCEYFMDLEDNSLVFKVAVGKLKGLKFYLFLQILNKILNSDKQNFEEIYNCIVDTEERHEFKTKQKF